VVLNTLPSDDVTIALSSSDTTEGTVSPASLTFTAADWDSPQQVTVSGVDDLADDGDLPYTIVTATATSADGNYDGLDAADVSVTNRDDERPFQNPVDAMDVDDNGNTTALDVLLIITYINANAVGELPDEREADRPYFDVNGDGMVSPLDVLLVVNFINSWPAEGEAEAVGWASADVSAREPSGTDSNSDTYRSEYRNSSCLQVSEPCGAGSQPFSQMPAARGTLLIDAAADEAQSVSDWDDILTEIARDVSGFLAHADKDLSG